MKTYSYNYNAEKMIFTEIPEEKSKKKRKPPQSEKPAIQTFNALKKKQESSKEFFPPYLSMRS